METLLILITCIAVAAAIAMAAALHVVLRNERRRSEIRVMALTNMAAEPSASDTSTAPTDQEKAPLAHDAWSGSAAVDSFQPGGPHSHDIEDSESARTLFLRPESSSPWIPRAVVGVGVVVLLLAATAVASWSRSAEPQTGAADAQARSIGPLDLVALRHENTGDGLTISGVVQNPHESAALAGVRAAAFLFADDGRLLASGRAPIDFPLLRPGDESPFVVEIAAPGRVARYRIGFRAADGRVIEHVDRRASGALARSGSHER